MRPEQPDGLHRAAWSIADELGLAKTYDAEYLALARILGCRLVTLDGRLRRGADRLGYVVTPTNSEDRPLTVSCGVLAWLGSGHARNGRLSSALARPDSSTPEIVRASLPPPGRLVHSPPSLPCILARPGFRSPDLRRDVVFSVWDRVTSGRLEARSFVSPFSLRSPAAARRAPRSGEVGGRPSTALAAGRPVSGAQPASTLSASASPR